MFGKGSFRKSHSRIKLGLVLVLALSAPPPGRESRRVSRRPPHQC